MTIRYFKAILLFVFCLESFASYQSTVLTRDKKMKLVKKLVVLEGIDSSGVLENDFFKIVDGKSDKAINLKQLSDKFEKLRAASVFYHLMKARNYFVYKLNSDYVKSLKKLTVRLNITNQFNSIGHFAHDNLDPEYNNALSIPPGKGRAKFGIKAWNYEIWFRPMKEIDLPAEGLANDFDQVASVFNEFRVQSRLANFQKFIADLFEISGDALVNSGLNILGSTAIVEASFYAMKTIYGAFQGKSFFLDTSMIPEVVYHEFAHVALSETLTLSHSSPVNEGMADYFAAAIADSPEIAHNVKDYAKRVRSKDAFREDLYQSSYESNSYANIDFVLGVLWQVREVNDSNSDQMVYKIRKNINSSSNIRGDLIRAILKQCKSDCPKPFTDRIRLMNSYHEMGL